MAAHKSDFSRCRYYTRRCALPGSTQNSAYATVSTTGSIGVPLSASLCPSPRATLHDNPAVTRRNGIYRKATLLVDYKTLLRGRFRSLFTTLVRDYSFTSPASPSASASAFRLARYSGRLRPACSKRSLRGGMDFISPLRIPAVELLPSAPP